MGQPTGAWRRTRVNLTTQSAACGRVGAVLAGLLIVLGVACESPPPTVPVLENTSRPTPTLAPSPTPIPTLVPTATPTASPTPAPTPTETYTPAPAATPTLFPTPTATATSTPQPTPTPTPEPTPPQAAKPVCLPQEKQAISAEHQAVIEEWPESWRPVLDELATFSPAAFQAYTEKLGVYPNAIRLYTTLAYWHCYSLRQYRKSSAIVYRRVAKPAAWAGLLPRSVSWGRTQL